MTTINIYLTFNRNCEEAFTFYKSVFGGEFAYLSRFSEMPSEYKVAESDKDLVMHVSFPIGDGSVLMGSDTGGEWAQGFTQGTNFSVSINTDSAEEANRLFEGLSQGGKIIMPMNKTFWDSYFGMFTDQFGIQWMVSFDDVNRNK